MLSQEKPPQQPWVSAQLAPNVLGPTHPSSSPLAAAAGDGVAAAAGAAAGALESGAAQDVLDIIRHREKGS